MNLKKCSTVSFLIFLTIPGFAKTKTSNKLLDDIRKPGFAAKAEKLQNKHELNVSLVKFLNDKGLPDEIRYTCLITLARLNGKKSLPVVKKFFNNPSWMLRDAAIRSTAALSGKQYRNDLESRLSDPSLIVRTSAVDAIAHLGLKESAKKLTDALFFPANYHHDKPLWIHQHIIDALLKLNAPNTVSRLVDLLQKQKELTRQKQTIAALEKLTGKRFANKSVQEQVFLWRQNLISEKTF
ncbi:MAG: HEAT repeat domain-containing protein [Bacteriovoracia bacterium]